MVANISPDPRLQFFANDGSPLVGGKLYTYAAGTTTPLATYTTYTGATANTNPIILNSRGEASVWLGQGRYKFVLKTANDVEIWTQDNLIMSPGADGSGAYGTWTIDVSPSTVTPTGTTTARTLANLFGDIVSVKDFGAIGNGTTDDTSAFQAAMNYATSNTNVSIYIPSGYYKITNSITVSTSTEYLFVDIYGDGYSSQILQYNNSSVFLFNNLTAQVSFKNFSITPKIVATTGAAFYFANGNVQSSFENILYYPSAGDSTNIGASFYVCPASKTNDTVSFTNCYAVVSVYGYCIGSGSDIIIQGGRMIGNYTGSTGSSVGLYLTGGMGGVYVWATDFISHNFGAKITQDSGTSNREIFITQATFDSCNIGYSILDSSYNNLEGIWAASCTSYNFNFAPVNDAAILNISGGTIFNCGNGYATSGQMYGLSINQYGQVNINGVIFRNNKGRAISSNSGTRTYPCLIQNCTFISNGYTSVASSCQVYLAGAMVVTNNTFVTGTGSYAVPNVTIAEAYQSNLFINNNQGYQGYNLRATGIAVGASNVNVTNVYGQTLTIYFRSGTVNSIWVNDAPVYDYSTGSNSNCSIVLNPYDTFKVIYSVVPNISVYYN
jgi:hypothetical protein